MKGLFSKAIVATTLLVGLVTTSAFAAKGDIVTGTKATSGAVTTLGELITVNNVNETGKGNLIKNVNGQTTHTAYKENTNSCASCHMTHTANSKSLLFGTDVEDTCTSCHDGSLGFYDVVAGKIFPAGSPNVTKAAYVTTGLTVGSNAGRFAFASGVTGSEQDVSARASLNPSMHNTGKAKLSLTAAPGGNRTAAGETKWSSTTFTCASCHAPHGSYSDRLLHYNPNGFGSIDVKKGGFGLVDRPYVTVAEATTTAASSTLDYLVVFGTTTEHADFSGADAITTTYFNISSNQTYYQAYDAAKVVMVYKRVGTTTAFSIDTAAWLDSTAIGPEAGKIPGIAQHISNSKPLAFTASKGYASYTQIVAPVANAKANIARASVVALDMVPVGTVTQNGANIILYVTNNAALIGGEADINGNIEGRNGITVNATTKVASGGGKQFSSFCAACHTDYIASSKGSIAGEVTSSGSTVAAAGGVYDPTKFRHTTNNDGYSCARCHYAHGADRDLQRVATGGMALAGDEDVNPSSALKRYVNMAVCWGCHTSSKSSTLVNNKDYQSDTNGYAKPTGLTDTKSWTNSTIKWGVQN